MTCSASCQTMPTREVHSPKTVGCIASPELFRETYRNRPNLQPTDDLNCMHFCMWLWQPWDSWAWQNGPPRARTWNLRLRRPMPYPLGQQANWSLFQIDMWSSNNTLNFSIPFPPGFQDLQLKGLTFCHWAMKLCPKQAKFHDFINGHMV